MQRITDELFEDRLIETYKSIVTDGKEGKLREGEDVHPVRRLKDRPDAKDGISDADLMRLIAARLKMQGYVMYHDEALARAQFAEGLARLERIL
jgi:hypothetical protein